MTAGWHGYLALQRTTRLRSVENEIREAIELHLGGMREDDLTIPAPSSQVEYVDIAA